MSSRSPLQHGIRANLAQILFQLLQVFLVGLTIGMTRTVVPGLAETEFGLGEQQFFLLTSFVVVFGAVKATMNLLAGRFADQFGRKRILIAGWLVALNQAGLVEKFTDALVWIVLPVWVLSQGLTLVQASSVIGVYAVVWGASQLITGPASDRYGRKPFIVGGMWLCGIGVLALPLSSAVWAWTVEAVCSGFIVSGVISAMRWGPC